MAPQSPDSTALTEGIRVHARAEYVSEESDPELARYYFAYTITIANEGGEPAQLLERHWIIKDADNQREDVVGPGVVGQTPRILPGKSFTYRSACPLPTRWGTMEGSFKMKRDDGSTFPAAVGRFFLVSHEARPAAAKPGG